ncbi:MAG: YolD-like family protein [Clostridia bacterium]|nr:YolD-like family protein [Clostridia bacterium]
MSRQDRAKQFAPFDALKGLQDALRIKEFEHERVQRGEIQEEKANEISRTLISLEKNSRVKATYYSDGHYFDIVGTAKLLIEEGVIEIAGQKILLDDLCDVVIEAN